MKDVVKSRGDAPLKIRLTLLSGLLLAVTIGVVLPVCAAEEKDNIVAEPNLQLFTVLAAINAGGYDEGANRPELAPLRAAVRKELAARNISTVPSLREFYERHKLFEPGRDLGQYVSLALFLGPPPAFELQGSPNNLPPEVGDLADMVPLIAEFYKEADIPAMWEKYQPALEQEADRYRKFLSKVMLEINAYLRIDTSGYWNRKFAIYLSPLGAPNQTNARSYGDSYYIVVSPAASLPEDEIRHGWLHYLLDPYPYKYARMIESKAQLQQINQRIPALDASFRSDFSLLLTESLIRAIQVRRSTGTPADKNRAVNDAVQTGYYLTAYFYEAMEVFEKQPVGMRLYFPEMIEAINAKKELDRLSGVQFRAQATPEFREVRENRWSLAEQAIRKGEDALARGQYEQARQILEGVTKDYGQQPRALYDLAIIATQQKQPATAKQYFTEAASASTDPRIKAWSHIYLGRLLDLEGNRDQAKTEYAAALAAGDPAAETRAAAEKGLQQEFSPSGRSADEPPAQEKPRQGVPLGRD